MVALEAALLAADSDAPPQAYQVCLSWGDAVWSGDENSAADWDAWLTAYQACLLPADAVQSLDVKLTADWDAWPVAYSACPLTGDLDALPGVCPAWQLVLLLAYAMSWSHSVLHAGFP